VEHHGITDNIMAGISWNRAEQHGTAMKYNGMGYHGIAWNNME